MTWSVEDALGALKAIYQSEQKYFTNLTACTVVPVHAHYYQPCPKLLGQNRNGKWGGAATTQILPNTDKSL